MTFFRILEESEQQEPVVMAQLPSPPTKEVILVVEDVEAEVAAVSASASLRLRKFESRLALLESQVNSLLRKCQTQIGNNNAVIGQQIPKYRAGSCACVLET